MPTGLVIFDLDGTLVDSAPEIADALQRAWSEALPDARFPNEKMRIGPTLEETIALLDPALGQGEREAVSAAFKRRYDASDFSLTTPYSGIDGVLDALASRGVPCGLATNKRRVPTLAIAERWFPDRFRRIACTDGVWPDDGTRPRTKPAMVEWLARGARPGVVMVGDTASDVAAAREA